MSHRSSFSRHSRSRRDDRTSVSYARRSSKSRKSESERRRGSRTESRDPPTTRSRHRSRSRSKRRDYRFDSPPKSRKQIESHWRHESLPAAPDLSSGLSMDPMTTRPFREIYIGNIPPTSDVNHLLEFINEALVAVNGTTIPGNACVKGWISSDGHYAFIELRSMQEASNCMQFTGLNYMGYNIRVNRPKTYTDEMLAMAPVPTVPTLDPSLLALGLDGLKNVREQIVAASDLLETEKQRVPTDRLCIVNLDPLKTESQLRKEIEQFGQLKHFHLTNDTNVERLCVFEFEHINQQNDAMKVLTERGYTLKFADDAVSQGNISQSYISEQIKSCEIMQPEIPTRALMLGNIVAQENLEDDAEYFDIIDDIRCECEEYGTVVEVKLPRIPKGLLPEEMEALDFTSVGCAFVLYTTIEGASRARKVLGGRRFANRIVEAHFFSEIKFIAGDLSDPKPNFVKEHSSLYNERILTDPAAAADMLQEYPLL
ncbi:bifunctional RNA recognition motif domain/Nucleotide-binding alpha-beta plait domain superfamily/RNA-binding domain superfamily [Babesia duncani]|uniref:Bifunctional RNA recognition motif domain/Nucleotide-binding alpha-beta plait domain superfamily/RNA-binding domain superfamily n=1 Tax=Babesia duncani TaxID=323732 RepID=A0AAD9UMW6_9APIC|nr:bifunctional RNA recognition motif domain/Nucleotide-binding alpha-beta plait domain superfamily/RNA-binding domain superfamily [Babesia duncani]